MSQPTYALRNCSWGYKCDKTWETLIATDSPFERYCDQCESPVFLCDNLDDLAVTVARNQCAAFPERLIGKFGGDNFVVGNMQIPPYDVIDDPPLGD
ncbi:hypothetical protein N8198_09670 [Gammaproteobacteria bacterium]|nr:hypothetical protein [Gammaproteobacteria bacterium]